MRTLPGITVLLLLVGYLAAAGESSFSSKPAITKAGDKVTVAFTVSAPTDVEVAVLDAGGKVARHLAAGVLGAKDPPPEPLKGGLAQSLEWDGKDDSGKPAAGGPFKVRVRAGLRAELDGFLAESKFWIGSLQGLATDAKGNLLVCSSSVQPHRGYTYFLQVFNRKGEYIKTLMPMPADLPREKLRAFGLIDVPGDAVQPVNRFGTWPQLYPNMRESQTLCKTVGADGLIRIWDGRSLAAITGEGAAAGEVFSRPVWAKQPNHYTMCGPMTLVPAPDGKTLYLSGLAADAGFPDGRVYRMKNEPGAQMETFVDLPKPAGGFTNLGKGTGYPNGHIGIGGAACDKDGNLLVCDRMNGMVRAYSPEGKELGGFKVEWPQEIACSHRTGAVYVMTNRHSGYSVAEKSLVRFPGWKGDGRETARLGFKPNGYSAMMVLDDSADPPVIWAGGDLTGKRCLLRIEDRGDKLETTANLMDLNKDRFGVKPRLAVHPETDLVICNDGAATLNGYDGLTGKEAKLPFEYGADMGVGLDGNWYIQTGKGYSGYICRFDKDLKPIPVADPPIGGYEGRAAAAAKGSKEKPLPNALGFVYGRMGAGFCTVGLAADHKGRVYSMQMGEWAWYCVAVFGADGKAEDPGRMRDDPSMKKAGRFASAIFGPIETKPGGLQLDWRGNIYVGLGVVPTGHQPPPGFEKDEAYKTCVGSVVRFKPEGGAVVALKGKDAKPPADKTGLVMEHRSYGAGPRFLENATLAYPGLGCLSGNFGDGCMCRQPMFQVDGFGRIFYPNAITCSVWVVDNAGNEVMKFGQYGNIDSAGPGKDSLIKKPDVPLGWPEAVGVSHKAIYVSDVLNRRIVRLMKKYAAEETCEVK